MQCSVQSISRDYWSIKQVRCWLGIKKTATTMMSDSSSSQKNANIIFPLRQPYAACQSCWKEQAKKRALKWITTAEEQVNYATHSTRDSNMKIMRILWNASELIASADEMKCLRAKNLSLILKYAAGEQFNNLVLLYSRADATRTH